MASAGNADASTLRSGPPLRKLFGPLSRILNRNTEDSTQPDKGPDEIPVLTVNGQDAEKENKDRRRDVNSLPPWLHSFHQGESIDEVDARDPLLAEPPAIKPADHNNTPRDPKSHPRPQAGRGKVWNHARTKEAVTMPYHAPGHASRWQAFADSSAYRREAEDEKSHLVGDDWLEKNMPELNEPYRAANGSNAELDPTLWLFSPSKRTRTINAFQRALMRNAFVPLIFRVTVLVFTLTAFALGIEIYKESNQLNGSPQLRAGTADPGNSQADYICEQQTSTYMAFIVNIIASVYILFITVDEYKSAPLGLRSSSSKLRLLFFDLWFIIFSAANLSLAFNTLTDQQWSCFDGTPLDTNNNNEEAARSTCVQNTTLCHRQRGLVSVLLIAEIAWVMTFAISVLRVVERISR